MVFIETVCFATKLVLHTWQWKIEKQDLTNQWNFGNFCTHEIVTYILVCAFKEAEKKQSEKQNEKYD